MKVHIGKKIKEAVDKSGMTVTEFAEKINYSRRNIYSIFSKESIDTQLLLKIGKVLDQDFFNHFANAKKQDFNYAAEPAGTEEYYQKMKQNFESRIKELVKEVEYLKEINGLLKLRVEKMSSKR